MTGMVEKVARAMIAGTPGANGRADELLSDEKSKRIWLGTARAAIEAMMEPTEEMRIAALNTSLPGAGDPPLYEKCWHRMIQAALKEEGQ